jgi:hypothetical protein
LTIARYPVGAVNSTVAPARWLSSASSTGVVRLVSNAEAPNRNGNTTSPPSPKVNASGGEPANTSSGVGWSRNRAKVSALASTSRWKCMMIFGVPVDPDVGQSSATSSAAVSTSVNSPDLRWHRVSRTPGLSSPKSTVLVAVSEPGRASGDAGTVAGRSAAKR